MNAQTLEGEIMVGASDWITANATALEEDLKPLETAAAGEIVSTAESALKGVPVVGALISKAIAADEAGMEEAFAQGVANGIAKVASWLKTEGTALTGAQA